MVSTTNVLSLQMVSRSFEWIGITTHGRQRSGGGRAREQFDRRGIDGLGDGGQKLERFQEIFFQGGHVPFCLHHLRKDVDRTENVRPRVTPGRIRRVSRQDADPLRYHHRFHTPRVRPVHARVRQTLSTLSRGVSPANA